MGQLGPGVLAVDRAAVVRRQSHVAALVDPDELSSRGIVETRHAPMGVANRKNSVRTARLMGDHFDLRILPAETRSDGFDLAPRFRQRGLRR